MLLFMQHQGIEERIFILTGIEKTDLDKCAIKMFENDYFFIDSYICYFYLYAYIYLYAPFLFPYKNERPFSMVRM